MGAGKTSTGSSLSLLLQCDFVDLDEEIAKHEKRTISEIFLEEGEEYFRDCESMALQSISELDAKVYATGGGIVLRSANRSFMTDTGLIVYLRTSWQTLRSRLGSSCGRPS